MTTNTISIRVVVGATTYGFDLVGDPDDALFATQVGRSVAMALLGHREAVDGAPVPLTAGDGTECDIAGCHGHPFYWRQATCECAANVCYTHWKRQKEAGAFWCQAHERRAQWFQERYLR